MNLTSLFEDFIATHKNQLISSGVPELFWKTLHQKLVNSVFDAGQIFQLVKLEERDECDPAWALQALRQVDTKDSSNIFLVDHAWTYKVTEAKQQLRSHDSLRFRVANMLGLNKELQTEQLVTEIYENMWKINNTYSIGNAEKVEDRLPLWYITDEIGSAVIHSDQPNCRLIPFIYLPQQMSFSLLFPIVDVEEDELMCRDFAEGITDELKRKAVLLPWIPSDFRHIDEKPGIPDPDYYLEGHIPETLPDIQIAEHKIKEKYLVYTEYDLIKKCLTDNRFEMTENEEDADILWYTKHFKDFKALSNTPDKFVNQFPYEYILTVKDLLCVTCRLFKDNAELPKWLPVTYNLSTEVANFVSCYQRRQQEGLDNYWIIKPYNLARGLDIHITNNLAYIMRLVVTGPKIVQKYITNPVLFNFPEHTGGVKFDIRYVILLKSVKPLEVLVYKEFFLRFANVPFELNDFDDYEKHFTVMNYRDSTLKHMKCQEFKLKWESQNPSYPWKKVENKILGMIYEILQCAIKRPPPCGIAENPQSRAMYAADIMLEWVDNSEIEPKILEINFMPDCQRACDYYPNFFNYVFSVLFCNADSSNFFKLS